MKSLIIFSLILAISYQSKAADFYTGIRQMGMGGAAVAVVNDETSLLINPIGLGRLREPYVTLVDPEVTTNIQSRSSVQNLSVIGAADLDKLYEELGTHLDKRFYTKAQIFPSFVNKNFGFGFLDKYEITATRESATQYLDLNYVSDWAGVVGANYSIWGGIVKFGATGKLIDRVEYVGKVNPATQAMDIQKIGSEGFGLGVDLGLSISSPTDLLPTIAVIAKDVGTTSFSAGNGMRGYPNLVEPNSIHSTVDVAFGIFPIKNQYFRSTFTVEYDDVTGYYENWGTKQKLHVGVEVNLVDQLFFRAGYNRGYATGGFEWAFRFFQLQLAYYGEEIGTEDNPVRDDRAAIKAVFRF